MGKLKSIFFFFGTKNLEILHKLFRSGTVDREVKKLQQV